MIVLGPPRDFFGNGIHLNVIEAAAESAGESWRNINAIDNLVHAILTNAGQFVAALAGNTAAGGLMLAWPPTRYGAGPAKSSTRTTA